MAEPPVTEKPKRHIDWGFILVQFLEALGVGIACSGIALIELGIGVLLFGAYIAYLANSDIHLTK
jgi:hypothetical protein